MTKQYFLRDLVIGNVYQDREGIYIYKGFENGFYLFDEIDFDENDEIIVINELKRVESELRFEV